MPTPLDALLDRLSVIAERYGDVQPAPATDATQETPQDAQQEAHELAEAVAQALQDGAL